MRSFKEDQKLMRLMEGVVVNTAIVHAQQFFRRAKKGCQILLEQVMNDIPGSKRS